MRSARRRLDHDAAPLNGVIGWRIDAAAGAIDGETGLFDGFRLGRMLGVADRNEAARPPALARHDPGALLAALRPIEVPALPLAAAIRGDLAVPAVSISAEVPGTAVDPADDGLRDGLVIAAVSLPSRSEAPSSAAAPAGGDDLAKANRTGGVLQAPAERPSNAAANAGTVILSESSGHWFVNAGLGADVTLSLAVAGPSTISVDLAGAPSVGDGQVDVISLSATNGIDAINVTGSGTSYSVSGLSATVNVVGSEGGLDTLVVNGLGGNDEINATTLPAGVTKLTLDGGAGDDTLRGSQGADVILGGGDNDFVFGDNGNDVAFLGGGNDIFEWQPGDGNDTIEGQTETDLLRFIGSNASENINVLANGGRALFLRDVANITMDLDDVEQIRFNALGGADNIIVGDMSGTDVNRVELDLRSSTGVGDGAIDSVTVNATNGADVFAVAPSGGNLSVTGLPANTVLIGAEAIDQLTLNALGGDDVIDVSAILAGTIALTLNGGLGQDVFIGSAGDDLINGGDGNDTALMGAGNDIFVWNPGDDNDTLEGQAGASDRLLFNGANVAENISITANGGRVTFFRDIANVTMDLNDTEIIQFNALGGVDAITLNNLVGTDVTSVQINLAASNGLGDGAVDTVTINGTAGADIITLTNSGTTVTVTGLAYQILITGFESGDQLIINTLGGNDVVDGDALDVNVAFTANGGENDDTLLGGAAADRLFGENGNDFLQGNGGVDTLDGGAGVNTVIQ